MGSSTSGPSSNGRTSVGMKRQSRDYWYGSSPTAFIRAETGQNIDFYEHWEEDFGPLVRNRPRPLSNLYPVVTYFPETREINQVGVDFYRRVFEKIKEKGFCFGQPLVILIYRWLFKSKGMVGKIKPPMLTRNMRVFVQGLWGSG